MFVPMPPSSALALAGATVLANLPAVRSPSAALTPAACSAEPVDAVPRGLPLRRGRPGRVDHRPVLGRADHHLRERQPAGTGCTFRGGPQLTIADIDLDLLRQERARQGTFEDNRRVATADARYRTIEFVLDPPDRDLGLLRVVERFPFVRPIPNGSLRTATRPTTSRSTDWPSGCGDLHREGGDRCVRGSRLDPALIVAARARICWACLGRTSWVTPCRASAPAR